jgi:hypothetical protein
MTFFNQINFIINVFFLIGTFKNLKSNTALFFAQINLREAKIDEQQESFYIVNEK